MSAEVRRQQARTPAGICDLTGQIPSEQVQSHRGRSQLSDKQ
jgi:hypothetical protein